MSAFGFPPPNAPGLGVPVIVLPKLYVAGHSIGAGSLLNSTADRTTAKLAARTGATETNVAISASGMMADNAHIYGNLATTGGWVSVYQGLGNGTNPEIPARARAPYLSPLIATELVWGVNDIAQWGPANANFLSAWSATLFSIICRMRLGALYEDSHTSVTYGPNWNNFASTGANSGSSFHYTTVNGSTVTIAVPADYDGQAIIIGFISGNPASNGIATWTVAKGGTTIATGTAGYLAIGNASTDAQPYCIRIPTPILPLYQGSTLTLTISGISGNGYFDWWGIEANPAPLVIVADALRTPDFSVYTSQGWPYTPTDADILAVNNQNKTIAGLFSDGKVICDNADTYINKTGGWIPTNKVHPDERNAAKIAEYQYQRIKRVPGLAETIPYLGTV